jgi:hypothetical protein
MGPGPDFPPTDQRSRVRILSQRTIPEAGQEPQPATSFHPSSDQSSQSLPSDYQTRILAALDAIARVLGARVILLLAVLGGFALAYLAMATPTNLTIAVVAIYNLTVIGPLIWLTAMRN